jgi:hypothetical protein
MTDMDQSQYGAMAAAQEKLNAFDWASVGLDPN